MTPEQIQAMVKGAVEASGGPAWWVYLLLILCACVGSYFGSYLGEKGKNNATKEDIAAITEKVEAVKVTLASRGWVKQQHWVNREKYYLQILSCLAVMRAACIDLFNEASHKEAGESWSHAVERTHGWDEYKAAQVKLVELLGPAAVFVAQSAIEAIYTLLSNETDVCEDASKATEFYNGLGNAAAHAFDAILAIAQAELKEAEEAS